MDSQLSDIHLENKIFDIVAGKGRVSLMCAEAVPWRCHRSLVADALTVRGFQVEHIIGEGPRRPHTITSFAKINGTEITYPSMI